MKRVKVVWFALVWALGASAAFGAVVVQGPAGTAWVGSEPPLPPSCVQQLSPQSWEFRCPFAGTLRLRFAREGFELREVEVAPEAVVNLEDGWVPTPLSVVLEPPELAVRAKVFWLEGDSLQVATADPRGQVAGPRVAPGHPFALAVAGDELAGVFVSGQREKNTAPLSFHLRPGSSVVALCREPWAGRLLRECGLEVGRPSQLLRRYGLAKLEPTAKVEGKEGLWVLSGKLAGATLQAQAPELPVVVEQLAPVDGVVEVVFPLPRLVEVELYDPGEEQGVQGEVRAVRLPEELCVAEAGTDPRGKVTLILARGTYRLVGEAPGFGPAQLELQVHQPKAKQRLLLEGAVRLRGRAVEEGGQPVEGALVVAEGMGVRERGWQVESLQNLGITGADGAFQVTAPGAGPWRVWAQGEGFSSEAVTVTDPQVPVLLRVVPWCPVQVLPVDRSGNPVEVRHLTFVRQEPLAVQVARKQGEDGAFPVQLAPGSWEVLGDEGRFRGWLQVPRGCGKGLRLVVPVAEGGRAPRERS